MKKNTKIVRLTENDLERMVRRIIKESDEQYPVGMDEDGEFGEEDLVPIGVDNLGSQGTYGLVLLFSPLESDMVKDWNNDKQIQRFVEEERLFLNELSYDKWEIYGIEGDRQVRNYIMKNYSW